MAVLRGSRFSKVPDKAMLISNAPIIKVQIAKDIEGGAVWRGR